LAAENLLAALAARLPPPAERHKTIQSILALAAGGWGLIAGCQRMASALILPARVPNGGLTGQEIPSRGEPG
jgi:hypothetical protein